MLHNELIGWNVPVTELSPVINDKIFLQKVAPSIKEFQKKPLASKSINKMWNVFYGELGSLNGFKYSVTRCPTFTKEEIARFEERDKMVILLPPEIFTPEGLEAVCKVFPLRMSWTDDSKEVLKIFHSSKKGSCVATEMQSSAPYTTQSEYKLRGEIAKQRLNIIESSLNSEVDINTVEKQRRKLNNNIGRLPDFITPLSGYSKDQLGEKIKSEGGHGIGICTYMIASKLYQLITGFPFDLDTFSRVPGSFYKKDVSLAISSTPKGYFRVSLCPPDRQFSSLGVRSELVINEKKHIWQRFVIGTVA